MMKHKKQIGIALFGFVLLMPLSNMLGLTSKNDPIAFSEGTSPSFKAASNILQHKCVDCHSPGMTRFPFYAKLPIADQLMEKDIKTASARLEITKSMYSGETKFTPLMLARLEGVLRNDSMPPNLYLSMHWTGRLDQKEKAAMLSWIAEEREHHAWSHDTAPTLKGEPIQPLPLTVSLNQNKVLLGKRLFFDRRLSGDQTMNCASCHDLTKGGTDQARVSTGIRGQQGPINSPSVFNASYNLAQFWDGRAKDLAEQAAGPVANPGEMGADWNHVLETLKRDDSYQKDFSALYPDQGITLPTVTQAIATYEESLITGGSRFDEYLRGNNNVLTPEERNGYYLFKMDCASCHFGPTLGGMSYEKLGTSEDYFAKRGSALTEVDNGRFNVTHNEADRHVFKVPNLRNVEVTQPYFHDGSAATLDEAVRTMATVQLGKSLSQSEVADIVAFLKTLTGKYHGVPLQSLKEENL